MHTAPQQRDSKRNSERGSATILTAASVSVIVLMCVAIYMVGAWLLAQSRSQTAADLAALAAAGSLDTGGNVCRIAAIVAEHNQAVLSGCVISGDDVIVRTTATVRGMSETGEACAGPG